MEQSSAERLFSYSQNTVLPWDVWLSSISRDKKKLSIGWCAPFPPIPNGGAVMTEKVIQEMLKRKEREGFEIYAIPEHGKVNKAEFKGMKYAKLDDPLDIIFFFSTEYLFERHNAHTKYVAWQTLHFFLDEKPTEREIFERIKHTDFVAAPTKMAKKEYQKHGIKNISYVPEGIQLQFYPFTLKKKKKIIFISRSMYYKGIMPFLDAIPRIIQKHPNVIIEANIPIDTNSPYLPEIIAALKEKQKCYSQNFSYNSLWLSEEKIRDMYSDAAILLLPSNNEGFGIPIVEAMASGTIPIVANRPPMNELTEHNKTGICLPLHRQKQYHYIEFPLVKDIVIACDKILSSPDAYREIQKKAREKVEKEYTIEHTVDLLLSTARKIVSHNKIDKII